MAEPLVQNTVVGLIANQQRGLMRVIVRGDMCALMQQQLDILICILKRIIQQLELLGTNVIVVQTVNDKIDPAKIDLTKVYTNKFVDEALKKYPAK